MRISIPVVAAGIVFASLTAASAESGFETRNGVKNAPSTAPAIQHLTSAKPQAGPRTSVRQYAPTHSNAFERTRNTRYVHGDWKYELVKGAR